MSSLLFFHVVHCFVGDGKEMYFWEDKWVADRPFCFTFPRLYHLTSMRNHSVVDVLVLYGSFPSLSLGFCRLFFDREMTDFMAFL